VTFAVGTDLNTSLALVQNAVNSSMAQLPQPVQAQGGITASSPGQVAAVSYSESGQPRPQTASASPQVTIQVNAMDSQSFLDHSDHIAMAVKQAILNSSSLNDVISGL